MEEEIYYCIYCNKRLNGKKKKYCSNLCKCKNFYKEHPERCNIWNKNNPKKKVNNKCLTCGEECGRKRYCSKICKPITIREPDYWKDIERVNTLCKICNLRIFIPYVHHINGNHKDNKKENLLVLCPSCHSKIHNPKLSKNIKTKKDKEFYNKIYFYNSKIK